MEIIASFVILLIAIVSSIGKDKRNPVFIFSLFWAIIIFITSFYWLGYNKVSSNTIGIVFTGIISYSIGGILFSHVHLKKNNKHERFQVNIVYSLATVGIAYTTYKTIKSLRVLLETMSFAVLRKEYWIIGGRITSSMSDYIFDNFIISALAVAIPIITFTEFFNGKKYKFLIFSSIYLSVTSVLCNGGRLVFLNLLVAVLGAFLMSDVKRKGIVNIYKKLLPKTKRVLKLVSIVAIGFIVFLTVARQSSTYTFFEAFYSYFTLEMSLLDYAINLLKCAGDITFGAITTMGFTQPIAILIKTLGFINYPEAYNILAKYTSPYYDIGGLGKYNAFVTQFFYFYLDARMVGVVVFDIILGIIYMYYFKKMKLTNEHRYIAIYILIVLNILQSSFRFSFSYPYMIFAIIFIYLAYHSSKYRIKCQ